MHVFYPSLVFTVLFSSIFLLEIKSLQKIHYSLLILVVVFCFIIIHKSKIVAKYKSNLFVYWGLFLIVFSIVHTLYYETVNTTILFYFISVLTVCSVILSAKNDNEFTNLVAKYSIGLLFILVLSSWVSIAVGVETKRFSAFSSNANAYTINLAFLSLFSMCYFVENSKRKLNSTFILLTFLYICSFYFTMLSGSRKTVIFYLFIFIYWVFLNREIVLRVVKNNIIKLCLKALLAYSIFSFLYWFYNSSFSARILTALSFLSDGKTQEGSINERMDLLYKGLELWNSAPLLGVGFDGFRTYSGFGKYSHNNYVEILANTGIISFFVYYFFTFLLFVSILKFKRKAEVKYILLLMLTGMVFFDLTIVSYYNIFFILTYGFIFHKIYCFGGKDGKNSVHNSRA